VTQLTKDVVMADDGATTGPGGEGERPAIVEPGFLTLEDVARYLSVSVPQVYALVRSRELPAIKIGGRGVWRVGRQQLQEYIDRLHRETQEWAKAHPLNPRESE
jgi:excisionase family DNA binding protein